MSPDPKNSIGAICVGDIKCYPIPDGDYLYPRTALCRLKFFIELLPLQTACDLPIRAPMEHAPRNTHDEIVLQSGS